MEKVRKSILISNDDGYQAKGIHDLIDMARKYGDVVVVAPNSGRSGASMSISSSTPVTIKHIKQEAQTEELGSLDVWACSGTPDDCVKMA
ncbi:MAG: 5'/3'-nucleotidase SurE, partial [Bacteroidaceae bacterium]|nr:5'/3'-nucleotidase SurE [Bacteroidaceae bacterium]